MERDRLRRGHLLQDNNGVASSLPTLPSVAELLASSRPASDSTPAYHHQPSNPLRPVSRSTPPAGPLLGAPANASMSSEHSYLVAANHASQASPTESATSTSSSEPQYYPQPTAQPAVVSFTPASMSEACQSLHDAPNSQTPINARRQDSAIAQQRIETSKEGMSLALSSEYNFAYSRRSPNHGYHSSSPGLGSCTISHSSTLPARNNTATPFSGSHERVGSPSAPAHSQSGPDLSPKRMTPSLPPDHTNASHTRQQRYNVRFAANHTPANMPSAQRSQHSPPLATAPAPTEPIDSPSPPPAERLTPTIEPAIQAIARSLQHSEPLQPQGRGREISVERCPRCYEAWDRPLPNLAEWDRDSPAESATGFNRANMNLVSQIQQHGKEADQLYEQWKEKHSHCPRNGYRDQGTSPDYAASTNPPHNRALYGHSYGSGQVHTSNKRKSEVLHGDTPKLRKVTFDAHTTAAPPVRPSAPI